ncbi:hypothetical protein BDN70DRAFT_896110 [Pholiota conissans]|uniref:Uncharacterized protein n=1 Tax=Pholiota conissans TaxID=109636 RepID=A0A9P5Z0L6_9AGAR|nr:hypothetical protein BDN70DRAFT_896110 [Pholiota conissans]
MPLFGSSNNNENDIRGVTDNSVGGGRHHHVQGHPTDQAALNDYPGQIPGAGMGNVNTFGQTQASGPGGNYNDNNFPSSGQHGSGHPIAQEVPYASTGIGSGHQGYSGGRGVPAAGAIDHGTSETSGAHGVGGKLSGKIESAIGSIVGSDALKAKGLQKEQEANSVKLQGRELAEAERLEREALMRRERAVAHGANPGNSGLGAGNPGVGGQF